MTVSFYLFDVDHGQCAAIKQEDGNWCIFDCGSKSNFSPVAYISKRSGNTGFRFQKATISHFHGDHLSDLQNLKICLPYHIKVPVYDENYLIDATETCCGDFSANSVRDVSSFIEKHYPYIINNQYYGDVLINDLSLTAAEAASIGGAANSRVNNASVITRVDIYGKSILLCGDMEKEAWEAVLNQNDSYGQMWRDFVSNIDILVAPHHGHSSGYSTSLMYLAAPSVVLVSAVQKDPNIDSRYSDPENVGGLCIPSESNTRYMISTRENGHIRIDFYNLQNGMLGSWSFGDFALN